MPANKNQHFVPRCYLRPFTLSGEAKAINLFNVEHARAVPRAPVKGQCSGDYFYGDDQVIEDLLKVFEGQYATCLLRVRANGYRLTPGDAVILRRFWLLQHLRTEAASLAVVKMMDQMDVDLGGLPPGYRLSIKEAVRTSMQIFFLDPPDVSDLGVCLVRNRTPCAFVTSDNPAVLTNRFHFATPWARGLSPGMGNAGALGLLPLASDILLLIYDRDVYRLEQQCGWVDLDREADADAFNQHQVLNCNANLYFEAWADRERAADLAVRLGPRKPEEHFKIKYAVLDHVEGNSTHYRVLRPDEPKSQGAFIHTSRVTPEPLSWPSVLSWRVGGVVYESGTGAGIVRKATRSPGVPHSKRRIHR